MEEAQVNNEKNVNLKREDNKKGRKKETHKSRQTEEQKLCQKWTLEMNADTGGGICF